MTPSAPSANPWRARFKTSAAKFAKKNREGREATPRITNILQSLARAAAHGVPCLPKLLIPCEKLTALPVSDGSAIAPPWSKAMRTSASSHGPVGFCSEFRTD